MANYRLGNIKSLRAQVKEWKQRAIQQVEEYSKDFIDVLGKLFVLRARENLRRYDPETERYLGNIYYDPYTKNVVVRSPQGEEPDLMWYLEFGTGIAGEKHPHPEAAQNGWAYAINKDTVGQKGSPWRTNSRHPDGIGWWVSDTGDLYHAKDDRLGNAHPHFFTSGIPPARYIYNTMMQIDELIELAKQKMNAERK